MAGRGRLANLWWSQGKEHPTRGKRKPESERAPKQTYDNYHRQWSKTPNGRASKKKSQSKWREKIAQEYSAKQGGVFISQKNAQALHKLERHRGKEQ